MRLARRRALAACALSVSLSTLLIACDRPQPAQDIEAIDASGESHPDDFSLTDHLGGRFRLSDHRGRVVALFFGYTQCADVCPTTLHEFVQVYRKLGNGADKLQVVFVTVDPERDTPQVLSQYVPAFDRRFIGLTGSPEEIRRVADAYGVSYQKISAKDSRYYTIDHTAYIFLLDRSGHVRLKVPNGQPAEALLRLIQEVDANP